MFLFGARAPSLWANGSISSGPLRGRRFRRVWHRWRRVEDTLEAARGPRAASAAVAEAPPADLCCSISRVLFVNHLICVGDGETYERYAIERWFQERQALLDEAQAELDLARKAGVNAQSRYLQREWQVWWVMKPKRRNSTTAAAPLGKKRGGGAALSCPVARGCSCSLEPPIFLLDMGFAGCTPRFLWFWGFLMRLGALIVVPGVCESRKES